MKLTIYTAIKNGIVNDLHPVAMLKHHLPLADEIVVNEGYSTDNTYDLISAISPKIKIIRTEWKTPSGIDWCNDFKTDAKNAASGDWCIHLDSDEFIPEWEFSEIRDFLEKSTSVMHSIRFINFYGNYQIYHANPQVVSWPARKMIIHRNIPEIEFWGDGSNVKIRGSDFSWDTDEPRFTVHHMGMIRDPAVLRKKWWIQGRAISGKKVGWVPPDYVFKIFPHDWRDPQFFKDLRVFNGPYIKCVRDDPAEFIRDRGKLVNYVNSVNR